MKCYMNNCANNDEWACMYREDCNECTMDCKNYYQCNSCDYYMDENIENNSNKNIKQMISDSIFHGHDSGKVFEERNAVDYHAMTSEHTEILGQFIDYTAMDVEQLKECLISGYLAMDRIKFIDT